MLLIIILPSGEQCKVKIFDINTAYFEYHGGYDYAVSFFEEAYRCAVEEIGGEQFVLSAVLHADERNKAVSEQLGYDVYHYHLHYPNKNKIRTFLSSSDKSRALRQKGAYYVLMLRVAKILNGIPRNRTSGSPL